MVMSCAFETLSTLDLTDLFDGASPQTAQVDAALLEAFDHQSGAVITGFPGADSLEQRIGDLMAFFALPDETRMEVASMHYRSENPNRYRGFFPLPEHFGWAHNEIFDFGVVMRSPAPQGHGAKTMLDEPNVWPRPEPRAGWRQDAEALLAELREIAMAVAAALVRASGQDEASFMAAFDDGNASLRILHYPPAPADFVTDEGGALSEPVDPAGRRIITRRHVDGCALSLLWQQDMGGLQYEGRDGHWRDVPAGRGRLSVHASQSLEELTGGRIKATPHRVVGHGVDRFSMGMFLEPRFDAVINHDGAGSPVTYADILRDDFASSDVYADVMA
jgi:isopenicillin N synthase-like dioxygenase